MSRTEMAKTNAEIMTELNKPTPDAAVASRCRRGSSHQPATPALAPAEDKQPAAPCRCGRSKAVSEPEDEVEATKAPLLDHLIELRPAHQGHDRGSLISSSLPFAADLNVLVCPYVLRGRGDVQKLIYTAPLEYFFTKIKSPCSGRCFLAFPVVARRSTSSSRRGSTRTNATRSGPTPRDASAVHERRGGGSSSGCRS